jgi:hypothetical protein
MAWQEGFLVASVLLVLGVSVWVYITSSKET